LLRPSDHDQPLPDAVGVQVSAFHNGDKQGINMQILIGTQIHV